LAETHSQGNEWLFAHFLKEHIAAKPYNTMINYRLYNDMRTIFISLLIDEFEHRVYTTDISGYTAADFDALMESVCTQYFTMSYVTQDVVDINTYWRLIVVDQPVYYLSYGMSAMASIDLYTMALEDFDAAIAAYQTLCEEPQEELGFLGNLKAAGLNGPFDEEFYIELAQILAKRG
jgi:oligoendopeptidase F